jgi:hypothetical protein
MTKYPSDVSTMSGARRLEEIENHLDARAARAWALARLDEMFAAGRVPDPPPDGFLPGRPLALLLPGVVESVGRRIADLHMPWRGKFFDRAAERGVNVLTKQARPVLRVLWPSYLPERELADRIEAFPFRTWVGPAAVAPRIDVLKIDYDAPPNPDLFVRRVLDELVHVDDRLHLGRALFRTGSGFRPLGYFCLESG